MNDNIAISSKKKLRDQKIPYQREVILPQSFEGERIGRNRVDFLIGDKIIIEIKTKRVLGREDYYQARRYQNSLGCKLTLLVNFHQRLLQIKRIINPKVSE